MAVIINDFEIIAPASPQNAAGAPAPEATAAPASARIEPHDIEQVMQRHKERLARLRAH
jgi:hypothetical protein